MPRESWLQYGRSFNFQIAFYLNECIRHNCMIILFFYEKEGLGPKNFFKPEQVGTKKDPMHPQREGRRDKGKG